MGRLPEGTVTFLFTDIEGSTRLLQELGAAYADALLEHRATLRAAFDRHRGVEVDTAGDSFFVAFQSAADAVDAAREARQALTGTRIKVRMGVHTGEPIVVGDGYVGIDVHRAARIANAAHGGQIILSERTRSLLTDETTLTDLGLHRLKDLTAPEHLFQLGSGEFPTLRTLNATNLPTQPSPLIGRTREIGEVTAILGERRVVTLTGPGGTGKTRLALQTAAELVDRFPDGVWWVPLAAVDDPELVLPTIGDVLGTDQPVAEHVDGKRMLALLDNLEQVLEAAPQLASLVRSCPNLHLLATSRAPLRIDGEREYAVDPLPEADAVELFRERAFDVDSSDAVAEICRRVDRLPLAVELAAARTRLFSATQLLDRLEQRLPLLTDGRRDAPERHRALRDTIAWSYELLTPGAQLQFERLGIFVGSFDLEAAEQIAGATVDHIEALVESSLVRHTSDRFTMLETIREYAVGRLAESGTAAEVGDRHLLYFLQLAERSEGEIDSGDVGVWLQRISHDEDNLRAAIGRALETGRAEEALRFCSAMTEVWIHTAHIQEGVRWFDLALAQDADPGWRARSLTRSGHLLLMANQRTESLARLEEAIALSRTVGDEENLVRARIALASTLSGLDHDRARSVLEEALDLSRRNGDVKGEYRASHLLGELLRDEGEYDLASALLRRALDIAAELGSRTRLGGTTHSLADLELDRHDIDAAEAHYLECLRNAEEIGLDRHKAYCIAGLAAVAAARGDDLRAARFWVAVEEAERDRDFRLLANERDRYERCLEGVPPWSGGPVDLDVAVRSALGDEWEAGSD